MLRNIMIFKNEFYENTIVNPCDKARGHASNNSNLTPGTAHGDSNRNRAFLFKTFFLKLELGPKFLQK
jgi:hypothetical protein